MGQDHTSAAARRVLSNENDETAGWSRCCLLYHAENQNLHAPDLSLASRFGPLGLHRLGSQLPSPHIASCPVNQCDPGGVPRAFHRVIMQDLLICVHSRYVQKCLELFTIDTRRGKSCKTIQCRYEMYNDTALLHPSSMEVGVGVSSLKPKCDRSKVILDSGGSQVYPSYKIAVIY